MSDKRRDDLQASTSGLHPWISRVIDESTDDVWLRTIACAFARLAAREGDLRDARALEAIDVAERYDSCSQQTLSAARLSAQAAAEEAEERELALKERRDERLEGLIESWLADAQARACNAAVACLDASPRSAAIFAAYEASFAVGTRCSIEGERTMAAIVEQQR